MLERGWGFGLDPSPNLLATQANARNFDAKVNPMYHGATPVKRATPSKGYEHFSLRLEHLAVRAVRAHEFFVGTTLDDTARIEHQDLSSIFSTLTRLWVPTKAARSRVAS
jgi:hypothetical protein